MTSEKQLIANQQNAKVSTGPITLNGKAIVASNAVKHGIFTKDLIISFGSGQESQSEYEEVLNNLVCCLAPCNQMENLLVEKIALDFWRLRRVIRFETGCISKQIEAMLASYYSYSKKDNAAVDKEIQYARKRINWNISYLKCLEKNEVKFDKPVWDGQGIQSDITEDFYQIASSLSTLTREERNRVYERGFAFSELVIFLKKHGYSEPLKISAKLLEIYSKENKRLEEDVQEFERQKVLNLAADSFNSILGMIPSEDNMEKILKYERSLQKSIFQNLLLLKKLQGLF